MTADMHTHVLPGVDDGSPDVAVSVRMLDAMWAQGVRRVAATPHFYANHDTPQRFLRRRAEAAEKLRQVWKWEDLDLRIGGEVHYFEGISDCDALREMAIEGTDLIMVEMNAAPWSERVFEELAEIKRKQNLTPVVAHLDRYITPLRSHGLPARLEQLGVLVQVNANSLLHGATRRMVLNLLKRGQAHLLGSDCHGMGSRKPDVAEAWRILESKLDTQTLRELSRLEDAIWKKG